MLHPALVRQQQRLHCQGSGGRSARTHAAAAAHQQQRQSIAVLARTGAAAAATPAAVPVPGPLRCHVNGKRRAPTHSISAAVATTLAALGEWEQQPKQQRRWQQQQCYLWAHPRPLSWRARHVNRAPVFAGCALRRWRKRAEVPAMRCALRGACSGSASCRCAAAAPSLYSSSGLIRS
eukprot:TRINITY_DN4046_c0_g1_i3.p1 TRINITY_DN4046_c0_g1~~TRINITY_DN4046_c0_g1_i3.p1  ORF type:complete len:178 (+),score=55.06 TRINITY_DN4046_c0_g1_i3:579-1112(+)